MQRRPFKYIDPLSDFGFKRLLSPERQEADLKNFLNALLPADRQIDRLRPLDKELLGDRDTERTAIYDLSCITSTGIKFIIEIQRYRDLQIRLRLLWYATRLFGRAARRGTDPSFERIEVIVVAILEYAETPETPYVYSVDLRTDFGTQWTKGLLFRIVNLANFRKADTELDSPLDRWLYLIKNLRTMTEVPPALERKEFTEFISNAEYMNLTGHEQDAYDAFWIRAVKRRSEERTARLEKEESLKAVADAKEELRAAIGRAEAAEKYAEEAEKYAEEAEKYAEDAERTAAEALTRGEARGEAKGEALLHKSVKGFATKGVSVPEISELLFIPEARVREILDLGDEI